MSFGAYEAGLAIGLLVHIGLDSIDCALMHRA